jgi:hypothetical protein
MYFPPLNSHNDGPVLEANRRAFFQEHNIMKKVTTRTKMTYDKARYLLEMPEFGRNGTVFDHVEIFKTGDNCYVGVVSPYGSRTLQVYFINELEGWNTCPNVYDHTEHTSFYKKVDASTPSIVVTEHHAKKTIMTNFEEVRGSFVTEDEISFWLSKADRAQNLLARLFVYDRDSPRRRRSCTPNLFDTLDRVHGTRKNASQMARALERPLTDEELSRIKHTKGWYGVQICTGSIQFDTTTRGLVGGL